MEYLVVVGDQILDAATDLDRRLCLRADRTVAWHLAVRPFLRPVARCSKLVAHISRLVYVPCRTYYVAMQVMFYLVAPP